MTHYKRYGYITCTCDACGEKLYFSEPREVTALYDPASQMLVCDGCKEEFDRQGEFHGKPPVWEYPPDNRLDYEEIEREYSND